MPDRQSSNAVIAPVGSTISKANAPELSPADGDADLLALEMQFDRLASELLATQKAVGGSTACQHQGSLRQEGSQASVEAGREPGNDELEHILARLYPIEQAIMQTPARTIAGLGVKARHAAYVMSQYWEAPIAPNRSWALIAGKALSRHPSVGPRRIKISALT